MIKEVSKEYFLEKYPSQTLPTHEMALINIALRDMEKDAPTSSKDYLEFWTELNASAIKFIEEMAIATLPKVQTLRIMTAPESAGAAARIGWVASAPPFAPNPITTLYLPSIPESMPTQEQIDFWASFNKPFNRIIVIHELFPGHYMQIKVSRDTPHPVRLLFPYSLYIEGWATFCEKVALDKGWEAGNSLTLPSGHAPTHAPPSHGSVRRTAPRASPLAKPRPLRAPRPSRPEYRRARVPEIADAPGRRLSFFAACTRQARLTKCLKNSVIFIQPSPLSTW